MIDFVSTRTTDPQTRACAQLLAAVIAQAVTDAAEPLSVRENQHARNENWHARSAVEWLFGPDPVFSLYADLIGSSAATLREALLRPDTSAFAPRFGLKSQQRRAIRVRVLWARQEGLL